MPQVRKGARVFVHQRAYIAGDVTLEDGVNVWSGASIRGDLAPITIGENTNVQDNVTVHVGIGQPVRIGKNVTVGHNAILHGCELGDNVMIGMGSIVLDGAKIGSGSLIGAGTLIPGKKEIPSGSLVYGNPYRIVRSLTREEQEGIGRNAEEYLRLAKRYAEEGEGTF